MHGQKTLKTLDENQNLSYTTVYYISYKLARFLRTGLFSRRNTAMKITISDVARLAGVSTATVSHTINSTRYVSSDTKEKVYQAIEELGYTPDASARSFRTGKKKTIGFIVPDISNRFFGTMIESAENYLSTQGYHLIIANTKENMDREETNLRLLDRKSTRLNSSHMA